MKNDVLEKIYQKYYQPLFLFALSLTKNVEDAEDLVSETFVKAFLSYDENSDNIKNCINVNIEMYIFDHIRMYIFI